MLEETGIGAGKFDIGRLKNLVVKVPSLQEQDEILKLAKGIDDKIILLQRQNQTLEKIAQTLFKHWFIDFEFPNAEGKPYRSSGGGMVASEFGEVPVGWNSRELKREISVTKGLSYKGAGLADEGTPMHSLKSIFEGGGYKHSGIKFYVGEYKDRHKCKAGDIIVANTEQGEKHKLIGFPARIPRKYKHESIFTHHLFRVDINDDSYAYSSSSFTKSVVVIFLVFSS